jgi:splicing factor 1
MALSVAAALFEVCLTPVLTFNISSNDFIFSNSAEAPAVDADGVKRRKKRNRWGDQQENKAAGLMGLPTMIMANFTSEQLEAYTLHLRIEEISQKLRINDVVPGDGDR